MTPAPTLQQQVDQLLNSPFLRNSTPEYREKIQLAASLLIVAHLTALNGSLFKIVNSFDKLDQIEASISDLSHLSDIAASLDEIRTAIQINSTPMKISEFQLASLATQIAHATGAIQIQSAIPEALALLIGCHNLLKDFQAKDPVTFQSTYEKE